MGIIKTILKYLICSSEFEEEEEEKEEPPDIELKHMNDILLLEKEKRERQLSIREENKLKAGDIIKSYTDVRYISHGQFAKVYKARDMYNNQVALKRIHKDFERMVKRECNMLYHINSNYVIKLLDVFRRGDYYYMVIPFYETDLFDRIEKKPIKSLNNILKILRGVAIGINDLHKIGYIHGDIKLENIMIDSCYRPMLIDLGLAKEINQENKYKDKLSGTTLYIAPEVIDHRIYTGKIDVWALGVIMYILMYGCDPFNYMNDHTNSNIMFKNIKNLEPKYPLNKNICRNTTIYRKYINLNKRMLDKDYNTRIGIKDVLNGIENIKNELLAEKSRISLKQCHDNEIEHLKRFKTL